MNTTRRIHIVAITTIMAAALASWSSVSTANNGGASGPEDESSQAAASREAPVATAESLKSLIKAAQKEGALTIYSSDTMSLSNALGAAFKKRYGITVQYLEITVSNAQIRFAKEAEVGKPGADIIMGGAVRPSFLAVASQNNWLEPTKSWNIPALAKYPKKLLAKSFATLETDPMGMVVNTDELQPSQYPKTWKSLTEPLYKGRLALNIPSKSQAYVQFWDTIRSTLGSNVVKKIGANGDIKWVTNMNAATQAVGAGARAIGMPVVRSYVKSAAKTGAPIKFIAPNKTTGIVTKLLLTSSGTTKHPAAARLYANWLLSPEENAKYAKMEGGVGVYDTKGLPNGYRPPSLKNLKQKQTKIVSLLGAPSS